MAWWTTQLIFRGDTLISEGIDPISLDEFEVVVNGEKPASSGQGYTRVIVSGYALYGELRGFYALGVAHWQLDHITNQAFMSERSQLHTEPTSSLTRTQRAIVRECLINLSPVAWETSNLSFRQTLEAQ